MNQNILKVTNGTQRAAYLVASRIPDKYASLCPSQAAIAQLIEQESDAAKLVAVLVEIERLTSIPHPARDLSEINLLAANAIATYAPSSFRYPVNE